MVVGAVERLPVGRRGHRVADRVQQVAPQREGRRPVGPGGVRTDGVDQRQSVAVRADGRVGLGRAQQVGHGVARLARLEEVVPDAGSGRIELDQALGGVAVDPAATVRRHVVEQRIADEPVSEPVAGARGFDHQRGERASR